MENENIKDLKPKKPYTKDRLLNYGAWYIGKYAPTKAVLYEKLKSKTDTITDLKEVFKELVKYIDENLMAENLVKSYLDAGKNIKKASLKLREKKYSQEAFDYVMAKFCEELPDEISLKRRVENYVNKGKGLNYITVRLSGNSKEAMIVKSLYSEIVGDSINVTDILTKTVNKLRGLGKSDDKIIRKLLSDGYSYSEVKNFLKKERE